MNAYEKFYTKVWNKAVHETRNFVVCSINEATHLIFTEMDLKLSGELGKYFSNNHVYQIKRNEESGEYQIIDDTGQAINGFDSLMTCEYLKEKSKHHLIEQQKNIR